MGKRKSQLENKSYSHYTDHKGGQKKLKVMINTKNSKRINRKMEKRTKSKCEEGK